MTEFKASDELRQSIVDRIRGVVVTLVDDPDYEEMWKQFRYAHEVRSEKPWLMESEEKQGLVGALNFALAHKFGTPTEYAREMRRNQDAYTEVDDDYRLRLKDAARFMLRSERDVDGLFGTFKAYLSDEGVADYVRDSIEVYWQQCTARGFSGDPW